MPPSWREVRTIAGLIGALGVEHFPQYARRGKGGRRCAAQGAPPASHWYLAALGTDPRAQAKGVGSALLRSGLGRCDRECEHAYLECFERLVAYYAAVRLRVTGKIEMPADVPHQFSMWRRPR